jgi:hypothetical protein
VNGIGSRTKKALGLASLSADISSTLVRYRERVAQDSMSEARPERTFDQLYATPDFGGTSFFDKTVYSGGTSSSAPTLPQRIKPIHF